MVTTAGSREGDTALTEGDWAAARRAFEEALVREESPESHDGLGRALWWLREVDAAVAERQEAHAGFRARGDD